MKSVVLPAFCFMVLGCAPGPLLGTKRGGGYESEQSLFACQVPLSGSNVRIVDDSGPQGDTVTIQKGFQDLYRVDAFRRFGHMISMVPANEDDHKEASDAIHLLNSVLLEPSFGELNIHVSRPLSVNGRAAQLQIVSFDSGRGVETRGFLVQVTASTVAHMHYSHFELRGARHLETIESRLLAFAQSCKLQ